MKNHDDEIYSEVTRAARCDRIVGEDTSDDEDHSQRDAEDEVKEYDDKSAGEHPVEDNEIHDNTHSACDRPEFAHIVALARMIVAQWPPDNDTVDPRSDSAAHGASAAELHAKAPAKRTRKKHNAVPVRRSLRLRRPSARQLGEDGIEMMAASQRATQKHAVVLKERGRHHR